VLASNCKALAEVCGDAAYYFDPNHVDQISELLVATGKGQLTDQTNKTSKGKQLAAKFSWNQTTQGTVDAYKNAFHMARS
jgi:glycosyltransferase involved in cell wall biosynthesis